MKKIYKIIGIVAVSLALIFGIIIGVMLLMEEIDKFSLNNKRKNDTKTLSDYITHHSGEYFSAMDGYEKGLESMSFVSTDIKFDLLKTKKIKAYYSSFKNLLITEDNKIYETEFR